MIDRLAATAGRPVSRETFDLVQRYVDLLIDEAARQNLISATTVATVWERHILDSAQLVRFEPKPRPSWADLGSGAGLPGIVVAALVEGPVTLVEPRRLRADFLRRCVLELGFGERVCVEQTRIERIRGAFDVITARAVAALPHLLEISSHLSTGKTTWVLPKGRTAESELAEARRAWQGAFHVEQSITDADSRIIVATRVKAIVR